MSANDNLDNEELPTELGDELRKKIGCAADRVENYLLCLMESGGSFKIAAQKSGCSYPNFYRYRRKYPELDAKVVEITKPGGMAQTVIEDEILERALHGIKVPIFHQGKPVYKTDPESGDFVRDEQGNLEREHKVYKSDNMLMFMARAQDPEKYGDRKKIQHNHNANGVLVVPENSASPDEWSIAAQNAVEKK